MTKQEAVQKVQAEIDRLETEGHKCNNGIVAAAGFAVAEKLKWAISIFQQVKTKED